MSYDKVIEKLMNHFTADSYKEEALKAKKEFYEVAGIFDEESPYFEVKMAQFIDWYLFSRNLTNNNIPPLEAASEELKWVDGEKDVYSNIRNNRHSIFEFQKVKDEDVYIRDLFSGEKLVVANSNVKHGFDKSQYFETRLVPKNNSYQFAHAFCFHPPQAAKFILKEIKKLKKLVSNERDVAVEKLIWKLFVMKNKHEKYKKADVSKIYSNDSELGI